MKNGHFIISLDFELHWGIFDLMEPDKYAENLNNVSIVIDRLLKLSDQYNVKLTFATVGLLFARNKAELIKFSPKTQPSYSNTKLNAYSIFDKVGNNENDDPYHYAYTSLNKIKNNQNHEISTHTFSHYYTNEEGQTVNQFTEDLVSAKKIASHNGLDVKSIVFPRNQVNQSYLNSCAGQGIIAYRGTEKSYIYSISPNSRHYSSPIIRSLRLADSYFNLTGQNTYDIIKLNKNNTLTNLPSSRFLRPYNKTLKLLEPLKIRRIKKGMNYAAKHNEVFHLWWHPHNFGKHMEQNFKNLELIFKQYKKLNNTHTLESITMSGLSLKSLN